MFKKYTFLFILLILSGLVFSQQIVHRKDSFFPGWIVSLGAGPSTSVTDVKQNMLFPVRSPKNEWRFGTQFMLIKDLTSIFSLRGTALYSKVAGVRKQNNYYFEAEIVEANLCLSVNISNSIRPYRSDYHWFVGIYIGSGLTYYNSQLFEISTGNLLASRGFGKGSGLWGRIIEGIMIGGVELDYKINDNWGVKFQSANRWMDSDAFDSKTGGFPYDFYNITTVGVTYKFYRVFTYPIIKRQYQSKI